MLFFFNNDKSERGTETSRKSGRNVRPESIPARASIESIPGKMIF